MCIAMKGRKKIFVRKAAPWHFRPCVYGRAADGVLLPGNERRGPYIFFLSIVVLRFMRPAFAAAQADTVQWRFPISTPTLIRCRQPIGRTNCRATLQSFLR